MVLPTGSSLLRREAIFPQKNGLCSSFQSTVCGEMELLMKGLPVKKRTVSIKLLLLLLILALSLSMTACNSSGTTASSAAETGSNTSALDMSTIYSTPLKLSGGWTSVANQGNVKMYVNSETMAVKVVNTVTGDEWCTNPDDPDSDPVADAANKQLLHSQFQLTYYKKSTGIKDVMNSYKDSLAYNQVAVYAVDNGIAVHYVVGDLTRDENDVPAKITDARFQEAIFSKLDTAGQTEIQKYYKRYESQSMWALNSAGRNNIQRVLALLDEAGYTEADLQKDNYDFGVNTALSEKISFEITIVYQLDNGDLMVDVPLDQIRYLNDFPLYQIKLLENLAAASGGSDGYIFVPDGSGALLNFNQNNTDKTLLSLPIYGDDDSIRSNEGTVAVNQTVHLPVYGIKSGDKAMLAIVEEGAASGTIQAYRANRNNQQYAVYTNFTVCDSDYVYLTGSDASSSVIQFNAVRLSGNYKIRYKFLHGTSANYSGMAQAYQQYLADKGVLTVPAGSSADVPICIDTIGGVYGYKSVLGISYVGLKAATTYEQNETILQALADAGIGNIQLKLTGWFNNGVKHDYASKVDVSSELGGRSALKKLVNYCGNAGVSLYPDVDLMKVYQSGNGYSGAFDSAKYLDDTEVKVYELSSASGDKADDGVKSSFNYLLSPSKFTTLSAKFLKGFKPLSIGGLSLRTTGSYLYSDFNKNNTFERRDTETQVVSQLGQIKSSVSKLMLDGANDYTLSSADIIVDAPVDYSWYTMLDEPVPFYEMVVHGYIPMTGGLMNDADNDRTDVLRCIEYGNGLYYQLTYQSSSFLKSTEYDKLYRSNYEDLLPEISENYAMVNDALKDVQTARMIGHEQLTDNVYRTDYDNGISILVNYGSGAVTVSGVTVAPQYYAVVKG